MNKHQIAETVRINQYRDTETQRDKSSGLKFFEQSDIVNYVFDKQSEGISDIYKAIEDAIKDENLKSVGKKA